MAKKPAKPSTKSRGHVEVESSKHTKHALVPETETEVVICVQPNAACFLSHPSGDGHVLRLDADERGMVRFHAKGHHQAKPIELDFECRAEGGRKTHHKISLETSKQPRAFPLPENEAASSRTGTTLGPLVGDPLALSNQALIARGYPPRPDPMKYPARYARWYRRVSQPFVRVPARKVARPEVSFSRPGLPPVLASPTLPLPPPIRQSVFNASFSTWSGAYYTNPAAQFFWIEADWRVPGVFASAGGPFYSAAAEWIGLDNSGTDLYQSGTDSECMVFPFWGWTITNYWMWIQTLPFDPWAVTNFPISPGDSVSVDIFVADENGTTWFRDGSNGGLTAADNSVWFMLYNYSKGLSFWGTLPTAPQSGGGRSSTGFTGSTAEFIVERPIVNGGAAPLALFGSTLMQSCWYGDAEYGDRAWRLGSDGSSPFDGNLTYINMQDPANGNMLALPISLPDPTSSGGYEILWLWLNYS